MWLLCVFSLAAASFLLPATGEVEGNSFERCKKFFLKGQPPKLRPRNSARICQFYEKDYRFATMYDKQWRIPTFSAYIYGHGQGKPGNEWKIEPQLALLKNDPNYSRHKSMELEQDCKINRTILNESQAVNQDYENADPYNRGHLAPSLHQPDLASKKATFTLTNIVPQVQDFNEGEWNEYEKDINAARCHPLYVLVGAVPGNETLNNRVNIPSHMWAAGCCVVRNNRTTSWAVIASNRANYPPNQPRLKKITLKELQAELAVLYKQKKVDLFNNACDTAHGPQNRG